MILLQLNIAVKCSWHNMWKHVLDSLPGSFELSVNPGAHPFLIVWYSSSYAQNVHGSEHLAASSSSYRSQP